MDTQPSGPPYAPTTASLGGVPTVSTDVPITAVFLALYITGAVSNMTISRLNARRGHKFVWSNLLFGFCMARTVTCIMRIVWATRPTNVSIAIAAQVFVAAGVVLLFVVNLVFAQRITRAAHPRWGWHRVYSAAFIAVYVLIVITLAMLITCTVQSFYTLHPNTRRIDHDVQLYGQTFYAVISFLPIPIVLAGALTPRRAPLDRFGTGRFRSKCAVLVAAATLLCLGACFRVGTNYRPARPRTDPPAYYDKACFYVFNFTVEVLVLYMYIIMRVDKRFHVPDGAHGPGSYSRGAEAAAGTQAVEAEKAEQHPDEEVGRGQLARVVSDEEILDDMSPGDWERSQHPGEGDVERGEVGLA